MRLKPEQTVDLSSARVRALSYLAAQHRSDLNKANCVALAIWPTHNMTSQGAGAAASRILRQLQKDGLVEWTSNTRDWGYYITPKGRELLKERQ